ncbi:hypothetical protein [Coralliovum pocilloporae]|uniref:hypothetical protein n=1 Tax=Coralliovum pocilloporae TaxID=3066369 RepID=UPI00330731A0
MEFECNFCGGDKFVDMNKRPNAKCANCGSLERTRLMWMYLERLDIKPDWKILHIAPERSIYNKISLISESENYVTADFYPELYQRFAPKCKHIDLCDLDHWRSDHFDLILHSHVLEHTPCNIAYTLFHLHRMLTAKGKHVCIIPFMNGEYDETFQDIGTEERVRRFGQHDHVRRFGNKDISRHLGSLLRLPSAYDASKEFTEEKLNRANIPKTQWRGFGIGTVLTLNKADMKLLNQV